MNSVEESKNYIRVLEEKRPWGGFRKFVENERVTVKILTVLKNERLSLQYHLKRDEFWKVLKGRCRITIGEDLFEACAGDEFNIPRETLHRIKAVDDVQVLEISKGLFKEGDIIRIEDDYGRGR